MASELTDERVRGIVDGAKRGAVFAGLDSYDLVATLGEALLAARARIAELEGRRFRIMHAPAGCPGSIPWTVIAPHEPQAQTNHDQSLERLNARGGLDVTEAVAVLENRKYRRMPEAEAVARLLQLIDDPRARLATLERDLADARAKLGQASRRVWLVVDDDNDGQLAAFDEVVVYLDEKAALARCTKLNADDPGRYRAEWAHLDANLYAPAGEKER